MKNYVILSFASTTNKTYTSDESSFKNFIEMHKQKQVMYCLPAADEQLLTKFFAFLAQSGETYLATVLYYPICYYTLHMVLTEIKCSHGGQIRVRLPITIYHLKLFRLLSAISSTTNFDSTMIWAAMTLTFFGFLRFGKLTCNSKFNKDIHLTQDIISFPPRFGTN